MTQQELDEIIRRKQEKEREQQKEQLVQPEQQLAAANPEPPVDPQLQEVTEPLDSAVRSYGSIVDELVREKAARDEAMQDQIRKNDRTQLFGGVTEAAAALTNIFGTMAGAAPMHWTSPQGGWQSKAQLAVREREARLQKYDAEISAYQKQISSLQSQKAGIVSRYRQTQARVAAEVEKLVLKNQAALEAKMASIAQQDRKNILSSVSRMVGDWVRNKSAMGSSVSSDAMEKAFNKFLEMEIESYYER